MTDCGACLSGWDEEPAAFYNAELRKARKTHICCECGNAILSGSRYEYVVGEWDGDFLKFDTCALCLEIRIAFSCDGSWVFSTLWEDFRESIFPIFTTANECFGELSVKAKERVMAEWNEWKFGETTMKVNQQ